MALTEINAQALPPGFYAIETTAGAIPSQIADFSRIYMLVSGSTGDYFSPLQVTTVDDAVTKFGVAGQSRDAIEAIFLQFRASILYLVRVPIGTLTEVQVTIGGAGDYTVTVNGNDELLTTTETDPAAIAAELVTAINDENSAIVQLVTAVPTSPASDTFTLRPVNPSVALTVTTTASVGTLVATDTTGADPAALDYVYAINNSFDKDLHYPGFLLAPEAFYSLAGATDRLAVANAMIGYAAEFDWLALLDPGAPANVSTAQDFIDEGTTYTTARGHAAYYCPYLLNLASAQVAPSAYVAGIALDRYAREGFRQPPAGSRYPLKSILKPVTEIRFSEHATLNNQHNINVIKTKFGKGVLIQGARTRTTNTFFNTITDRVIFNVLLQTLRTSFDDVVFQSVDGQGELFGIIERTAQSQLYRLWEAGALYGASPAAAFKAVCNASNNPNLDLEAGVVHVDIFAVPSPFAEKVIADTARVAIGEMQNVGTIQVSVA